MNSILRRRRALLGVKSASPILPAEYQQVEYIKNTTGAYFVTNINFPQYFTIEATVQKDSASSGYGRVICGSRSGNYNDPVLLLNTDGAIQFKCWGTSASLYLPSIWQLKTYIRCTVTATGSLMYASNSSGENSIVSEFTPSFINRNIRVFTLGLTATQFNDGRIYDLRVINDATGLDTVHFIPCYRITDDVVGMYDIINDNFYSSSGDGVFTKGADV